MILGTSFYFNLKYLANFDNDFPFGCTCSILFLFVSDTYFVGVIVSFSNVLSMPPLLFTLVVPPCVTQHPLGSCAAFVTSIRNTLSWYIKTSYA